MALLGTMVAIRLLRTFWHSICQKSVSPGRRGRVKDFRLWSADFCPLV